MWGPKRIYLYNDAYAPIVGAKHPAALARGYPEVWPEIWDTIRPILEQVELTGVSSWSDNLLLVLQRHGFNEECYFAFSFAPVRVEDGSVGGVFTAITETTAQIVGERRLRVLRELGAAATDSRTIEGAIELAARVVAQCSHDVPFALFYQTLGDTANLAGFAGADSIRARFPVDVKLVDSAEGGLPFALAMQPGDFPGVVDLTAQFGLLNSGPWPEAVGKAVIMPIRRPGESVPYGFFVAGLSPRRPWDDEYRNFLSLLNNQVAASIANAVAYTEERARSERLRELDRAKTAFFSNVSHEFRTPLTLMLGPLEEEMRESPAPRERLQVVHRNSLRLLKLVNTLLDFSRIEAGRSNAVYEPTDLATYTSELASAFRSATDKAGLRLIVDCPPLAAPIYVDRGMWEKIVFNLLSNAFKFTFEGEIEIKLRDEPEVGGVANSGSGATAGQVCLSVRDTGTGIPAGELPRIFERFHRVQNARSRSHEGTGIGLALVAELARLHGGTVRVESTEGVGTTFLLFIAKGTSHLPRESIQSGEAPDTAAVSPAALIEEVLQWLPGDSIREFPMASTATPFRAAEPGSRRVGAQATILLADDNRDMREYVSRLLIAQGYEVEAVADGQAALEAISRRLPSLVLSDVMMPRLDGFGLLKKLRRDPAMSGVPIILLSARAGEEARVEGVEAGADDYLTKPFSARELLARVATHLELGRTRAETAARAIFLGRLTTELSMLSDPAEINRIATRAIGQFFAGDACYFFQTFRDQNEVRVLPDWFSGKRQSLEGTYQMLEFGPAEWWEAVQRGPVAVDDVRLDPSTKDYAARYELIEMASYVLAPFIHEGRWAACLAVVMGQPRHWTADEKLLLTDIVARVWPLIERTRAEVALREANIAAEAANQSKDRFLAVLSHELRTPLNPVLLLASEGAANPELSAEVRADFATIAKNVSVEAQLIDDLLDLTKISRGKLVLDMRPLDVHAVLQDALQLVSADAQDKRIALTIVLDQAPAYMSGDPIRLQQVFWNVLKNAVKFTAPGGRISVTSRKSEADDSISIAIADSGIGLTADELARMFEAFAQGEHAEGRGGLRFGGLGLGLVISQNFVILHGGSLRGESEGRGRGATFVIELPLTANLLPEQSRQNAIVSEGGPAAGTLRILLVEDHAPTRGALETLLRKRGHSVFPAGCVAEARSLASRQSVDLVISDIGLPDGSGHVLMSELRSQFGLNGVALTGYGMETDIREGQNAGFVTHLTKPVNILALDAALNAFQRLRPTGSSRQAGAESS
ncbi:MAG: ATP-binding protein [Opitutaceae bacterium]